jgi:hypothetical protein
VTDGREALAAWSFEGGSWRGVDLAGARAVAAIAADRNLVLAELDRNGARRQSVLYLDARAPRVQREALRALLAERYAGMLGDLLAVEEAPIDLALEGEAFRLSVPGVCELAGATLADRACCSMPESVCYRPLCEADPATRTSGVVVGNSQSFRYRDERAERGAAAWRGCAEGRGPAWARSGHNDAFVLSFRLDAATPVPAGRG